MLKNQSATDFFMALDELEKEKRINKNIFIDALETALVIAYKKHTGSAKAIKVNLDADRGRFNIVAYQTVVEQAEDREKEISLEDARNIDRKYKVGDVIIEEVNSKDFGRIAAQTAKQVIMQKMREIEGEMAYNELAEKESELITCVVRRVEGNNAYVEINKLEALLSSKDQLPGDHLNVGDKVKVYVKSIKSGNRGPQIMVSRTVTGFIKKLFEMEVPEIANDIVQIKAIVREAGFRTKIAVYSQDPKVDPIGACVGNRGSRVNTILAELGGEKIDIIPWHEDPLEFIARALSPAKVVMVETKEDEHTAKVVVVDDQLSLAIGKDGVNARLAAKLTGWKIDIKPYTLMEKEVKAAEEKADQTSNGNFEIFDEDLGELD